MKKALNVIVCLLALALLCACSGNTVEQEFRNKAEAFADSLISRDYKLAIEMPYYKPEHEYLRDNYRDMLETDGSSITTLEIIEVHKLSEDIYQLEGVLTSSYGYDEPFLPFYFQMDGEWHYAMNEFEVPEEFLNGLDYLTVEGALDPDEYITFPLG